MALIATLAGPLVSNFVIEDDDYIYINSLAHDKTTLTPVWGRYTGIYGMPAALNKAPHMRKYMTGEQSAAPVDCIARDSTIANPSNIGYVYPLFKQTQSGNYYHMTGGSPSAMGGGITNYIYGRALGTAMTYDSTYSVASWQTANVPVAIGSKTDGTALLILESRYGGTSVGHISSWPAIPGVQTSIVSGTYLRTAQVIYEDDTKWFIAVASGNTVPNSVTIQAISKAGLVATQVYANTAQGSSYPSCNVSGVYSLSASAKYAYCVVSNATDPVYTIRYFNINPSTPTATAGSVTIDWGATTSAAQFATSNRTSPYPLLRTWIVHTSTADYVCFALMEFGGLVNETTANMKMHVFTINSSDPTQVTFKQTVAIGSAHGYIKNVMPIADDYTSIMVITASNINVYSFDDTNGYTAGATIPHSVFTATTDVPGLAGGIGVDELGRIWVQNAGNIGSALNMYSTSTSTSITLTFASSSYNYTGTTISSSFNLSAYNSSGARIATDIQVVLEPNCTFSDDTTTKTITTSSSAETSVNIKITGPGQIRAIANVAI